MDEKTPVTLSAFQPMDCQALAGRCFTLCLDDGHDRQLEIISGGLLRWEGVALPYQGADLGQGLYFLTFDVATVPRVNLTLALDVRDGLVTLVTATQGQNPKRPTLIQADIQPGAIQDGDRPLNPKRHGYTADLVGKAVKWQYGPAFAIIHIYVSERYYRIKLLQRMGDPDSPYEQAMRNYVDPTEPAFYLRIRPGVILFGFIEDNMDKVTGPEISCASRVQLIDLNAMRTVGRGFGAPGGGLELFGAEGEFVSLPASDFTLSQSYTI